MSKIIIYNIKIHNTYRFINLSEEKTSIEKELKSKLNATNNTIYILTKELESLQKEIEEKNINNNKLFEDCQNLTYLIETKTSSIKQLKLSKKQLEQKNLDLEYQLEQNMKEIEYLKAKNILNVLNSEKNENKNNCNSEKDEYYEKQLNDSNKTIKKMGEMIHELEKQIEELQKELENNNYIETKINNKNNTDTKEFIELIKKKDKEIKQYQVEIRILNEEKSKLYEDNTKMYTNLDRFQKYILKLIQENKILSKKINKYTNSNEQSQLKENKSLNESDVNEDDISKNNYKEINLDLLAQSQDIEKENNNEEKISNVNFNRLSDSEINQNMRDIKVNKNKKMKIKNDSNKENESQNENKVNLYFEYDGKENDELSD